jgi:hypothetical protein
MSCKKKKDRLNLVLQILKLQEFIMCLEKINTRIVVYNDKSILNNFIMPLVETPLTLLQWVTNGKTYYITLEDNKDPSTLYKDKETTSKITRACKKIFGTIAIIFLFPIVGLALFIKIIILNTENSKENYNYIKIHKNFPILVKNNFSKVPQNLKPSKKELRDSENINIKKILTLWDKVGKKHLSYEEIKNHLNTWLNDVVPNPKKYTHIDEKLAPLAAKQLEKNLKLIINLITTKDIHNDKLEETILNLYSSSKVCSPTWIEVVDQEYKKHKGGSVEDRILMYVQKIKEETILAFSQKILNLEWHSLNYMRQLFKNELGLGEVLYDTITILKWYQYILISLGITFGQYERFSKKNCRIFFYRNFSHERLIKQLEKKINMDTLGNCDPDISTYLESCAIKHAKKEGIDVTSNDFDSANYVYENFYETKKVITPKGKEKIQFLINYDGATEILIKLGLLDYA